MLGGHVLGEQAASRRQANTRRCRRRLYGVTVSVPEKTLEHWSSQYVTYRYKSAAAQWWPTKGEDIDVRWLPTRPGKAIQLELKTTTWNATRKCHEVHIDLGQLWTYLQRPLGRQPFYAFPRPHWHGELRNALPPGYAVTELAYRRSGPTWWFANWMVIVSAADVAAVLGTTYASTHGPERKKATLVRFTSPKPDWESVAEHWHKGASPPPYLRWPEFWTRLQQCGDSDWPQLIRVPLRLLPVGSEEAIYSYRDVVHRLGQFEYPVDSVADFLTLLPDGEGRLAVERATDAARVIGTRPAGSRTAPSRRQLVFLDARELKADG